MGIASRERRLERDRQRTQGRRVSSREYVREHLKHHPCIRCGETDYRVLQFHHRDGNEKIMSVSRMVNHAMNIDLIKAEMDKCDVMCSNCHIVHHWEEREMNESLKAYRTHRDQGTGRRGHDGKAVQRRRR